MNVLSLDSVVTVREASLQSGVPRSTVYHFIRTGKVIPIRVAGVMFITREDVARMRMDKANES